MKRFKLGFGNRTVLEQIAICRRVAAGIARLPAAHRKYAANHPVADSADEAAAAHAEVESLKTALKVALARREAKLRAMRGRTTSAALMVMTAATGDPAAMLAAGLGIVRDKKPVGLPGAPTRLRVVLTDFEGRVRLRWKRPVRRCVFRVEMTTDRAAKSGWKQAAICVRQTCDVTGLVSGKKYWFRVAANNARGQGPWSQAVAAWVK
jgi:Fibronectin type III domain